MLGLFPLLTGFTAVYTFWVFCLNYFWHYSDQNDCFVHLRPGLAPFYLLALVSVFWAGAPLLYFSPNSTRYKVIGTSVHTAKTKGRRQDHWSLKSQLICFLAKLWKDGEPGYWLHWAEGCQCQQSPPWRSLDHSGSSSYGQCPELSSWSGLLWMFLPWLWY